VHVCNLLVFRINQVIKIYKSVLWIVLISTLKKLQLGPMSFKVNNPFIGYCHTGLGSGRVRSGHGSLISSKTWVGSQKSCCL